MNSKYKDKKFKSSSFSYNNCKYLISVKYREISEGQPNFTIQCSVPCAVCHSQSQSYFLFFKIQK